MRVEGDCPRCGNKLGMQAASSVASMMGDTIKRMMDRDGNAMRCPDCDDYVDPDNLTVKENY